MSTKAEAQNALNLLKKRSKGAWKKARQAEPREKGRRLPPDIEKGVAQFTSYNIKKTKNGDPMCSLSGVVFEPEECKNLKATVVHIFKSTDYKSIDDKLAEFSSDVQLLGGKFKTDDLDEVESELQRLVKKKPFFYFRTWRGDPTPQYPNPDTKVFISGLAAGYDPDAAGATDEDEEAEDSDYDFQEGDTVRVDDGSDEPWDGTVLSWDEDGNVTVDYDGEEYVVDADHCILVDEGSDEEEEDEDEAGDEEEEDEDEGGEDEEDEDQDGSEDEDDEEGGDDEDWAPEKGDIYHYRPARSKTAVEGEVTSVNRSKQTVTLKAGSKTYKDVPWDKLED